MANTEIKLIIISIFYKIQYMQVLQLLSNMLRPLLDAVDNSFSQFEPLTKLAQLLRVRPAHIALSIFILGVISLGTGVFSKVFVALFGMIYPAYMTFKALGKNDHEQNKYWLTYWIVFGLFTAFSGIIKSAFFFFLSYRSYNVFRIMFYLFLFHPSTQGAKWIYEGVLKRRLNQLSSQTPNTD